MILIDKEEYKVNTTKTYQMILFGDQLTVESIQPLLFDQLLILVLWINLRDLFQQLLISIQKQAIIYVIHDYLKLYVRGYR